MSLVHDHAYFTTPQTGEGEEQGEESTEDSIDIIVNDPAAAAEAAVAEEAAAAVEKVGAVEDEEPAAATAAAAAAIGASGSAKKSRNLCKWSWANKQCTPTELCQYKYQVRFFSQAARGGGQDTKKSGDVGKKQKRFFSLFVCMGFPVLCIRHAEVLCTLYLAKLGVI